jgi:hypothetical protein
MSAPTRAGHLPATISEPTPPQRAPRQRRGLLVAAIVGTGLLFLLGLFVLASAEINIQSTIGEEDVYQLSMEFSSMPADDAALEAWVLDQPGVRTVGIRRLERGRLQLRANYLPGRPARSLSPPWQELGYQLDPKGNTQSVTVQSKR